MKGYNSPTQTEKNIAWFLPRPKKDRYKGGMPLYCEEWLVELAKDLYENNTTFNIMNLFCGTNKQGLRVDIKKEVNPDICCDAHKVSDFVDDQFDFILADPPYSTEESKELYNTGKLNYKTWTKECDKLLKSGGLLCVYHKYIMPNPNPDKFKIVKRVFIGSRTYHLPRVAIYFKKIRK